MSEPGFSEVFARLTAEAEAAAHRQKQRRDESAPARESLGIPEPIVGVGTAADERITVTVEDGRLTACEIQPIAARLNNAELGEQVCVAVNAAIDAYTDALTAAMAERQVDLGGLSASLRQIQADAQTAMNSQMDAMLQMLRSVKDRE